MTGKLLNKMLNDFKHLSKHLDFIFNHEDEFLSKFAHGATDLIEVHFSDTNIKYVFLLSCGQHIVDAKPIEKYLNWRKQIESKGENYERNKNGK